MVQRQSRIEGLIDAQRIALGEGVVVEKGAEIHATWVEIGNYVRIGRDVRIDAPEVYIGGYSKIHPFSFFHGPRPLRIGRNVWIGEHSVLDTIGGLLIADNVGIGAHSQVWTHIRHGDMLRGCRFNQHRECSIGRDAWMVGHCILAMANMAPMSMALVGSVVTKDTKSNHVYAGVPAADVSSKVGYQFPDWSGADAELVLLRQLAIFEARHPEYVGDIASSSAGADERVVTVIDPLARTYNETLSEAEVTFRLENPEIKIVPT